MSDETKGKVLAYCAGVMTVIFLVEFFRWFDRHFIFIR